MVGRYAIAYKNLNEIRKIIKLVIILIKFYFNLLSALLKHSSLPWHEQKLVHVTLLQVLDSVVLVCDRTTICYSKAILKF